MPCHESAHVLISGAKTTGRGAWCLPRSPRVSGGSKVAPTGHCLCLGQPSQWRHKVSRTDGGWKQTARFRLKASRPRSAGPSQGSSLPADRKRSTKGQLTISSRGPDHGSCPGNGGSTGRAQVPGRAVMVGLRSKPGVRGITNVFPRILARQVNGSDCLLIDKAMHAPFRGQFFSFRLFSSLHRKG